MRMHLALAVLAVIIPLCSAEAWVRCPRCGAVLPPGAPQCSTCDMGLPEEHSGRRWWIALADRDREVADFPLLAGSGPFRGEWIDLRGAEVVAIGAEVPDSVPTAAVEILWPALGRLVLDNGRTLESAKLADAAETDLTIGLAPHLLTAPWDQGDPMKDRATRVLFREIRVLAASWSKLQEGKELLSSIYPWPSTAIHEPIPPEYFVGDEPPRLTCAPHLVLPDGHESVPDYTGTIIVCLFVVQEGPPSLVWIQETDPPDAPISIQMAAIDAGYRSAFVPAADPRSGLSVASRIAAPIRIGSPERE